MSKLILFDFECPKGHLFEDLVRPQTVKIACPQHGLESRRVISPPRIAKLDMALSSSASPESISYFDKVHRQQKAIEEKRYNTHGDYGHGAGSD